MAHHRFSIARSLNYVVGSNQDVRRNRQADLLRCFQVDDEFKFRRLLDGKVGWLSSFENFVNEHRDTPIGVDPVNTVRHETPSLSVGSIIVQRRQSNLCRKFYYSFSMRTQNPGLNLDESVGALL